MNAENQKLSAIEKGLQAMTVGLLAICSFFLIDVYARFNALDTQMREHALESERRLATLEAHSDS